MHGHTFADCKIFERHKISQEAEVRFLENMHFTYREKMRPKYRGICILNIKIRGVASDEWHLDCDSPSLYFLFASLVEEDT